MTRLAILGARGIGAVHARVFVQLGAEVVAIAGASAASAAATGRVLEERFGILARTFGDVEELLEASSLDALVIATPPACHRAHLELCLERALPVLCEKPLYWPAYTARSELDSFRTWLAALPDARLLLNTVSVHFLEAVEGQLVEPRGAFTFEFHTLGRATGDDIAVDLLPHALALLARLDPVPCAIAELRIRSERHRWRCTFRHGTRAVCFDLRADPAGAKHLAFALGEQRFTRVQAGDGHDYRVCLHNDALGRIDVADPFATRARRFLELLRGPASAWRTTHAAALDNLARTQRLLLETVAAPLADTTEESSCLRG